MTGFCLRLLDENIENGLTLLQLITPRQLHAEVMRTNVEIKTIAELDAELQKAGLPPMRQVFSLDYKGSPNPDDEAIIEPDK